nr:hypothetical protein [Bacteroidota bacterium]
MKQVYKYFLTILLLVGIAFTSYAQTISASAGPDSTICASLTPVLLQDASASNYDVITWTTDGTGSFTNGSTVNATYNQSVADTATGFVTLTITATSLPYPATQIDSDEMILTFWAAPTAYAGTGGSVCESGSFTLTGAATNYDTIAWTTSGDGSFGNAASLSTSYTPGTTDPGTTVTLTLTAEPIDPCTVAADDNISVWVQKNPIVEAGDDKTICDGETHDLNSQSLYTSSMLWTTSGSGSFDNDATNDPTYTPSAADLIADSVYLKLTVQPVNPCTTAASDSIKLTFQPPPTAYAGADATTCEDTPYTVSDATATYYSSVSWATTGTGTFDDDEILNTTYDPSHADGLAGSVTLTLYAEPTSPCTVNASDEMVLTVGDLAEVNAGDDKNICNIGAFVDGTASNYIATLWTTYTGGSFTDPTALSTYYTTSSTDRTNGGVLLELFAAPESPCVALTSDQIYLTIIQNSPVVFAGDDATTCEDTDYTISDATASNYLAVKWSTESDGTWDDDEIVNPTYTLGSQDIADGFAILKFVANPIGPCTILIEDQMTLTVQDLPIANAGDDATICEDDNSYYLITSTALNYSSINWYTTLGTGSFDNANALHPTYTIGPADIIAGSVELCMALAPISPCTVGDTDCMTLIIQRLPDAYAGIDNTICEDGSYTLSDATAVYYSSITWTSNGDGTWSGDPLTATYTPGSSDKSSGSVELCLKAEPISPCTISDTDCMILSIQLLPIAYAGANNTICEDGTYTLSDATAQYHTSVTWTGGDGSFDNENAVNPTYTPGSGDIAAEQVELCLTAEPISPCTVSDTDCMTLYIQLLPIAFAGDDNTICEDGTYTISDATAENYSSITWSTTGDGSWSGNPLTATYTPGTADITAKSVELCLRAEPISPCTVADDDCMTLSIQLLPTVYAGPDATICEYETHTLSGATGSEYTSIQWVTTGDGGFSSETILQPIYSPGTGDKLFGSVSLIVLASPISPCATGTADTMLLTINPRPDVTALTLDYSLDQSAWNAVGGDFTNGFELCIDSLNEYYYLDVNALTANVALLQSYFNPFYLDESQWPAGFEAWWSAKGVNAGAASGTWQEHLWKIINGQEPQFYLTYDGSDYKLIDGLMRDFFSDPTALLKLNGNYPNGTYYYDGTVISADSCESDSFTVSLLLQQVPTVFAGDDNTICEDGTYTLADAWAKNYSSVTWATNGDGSFDAPGTVNPIYTPGSGDISTGTVELCITGEPISPCTVADEDCMILTIHLLPIAFAGDDNTICEDDTYTLSDATAENYSSVTWATNGDGTFDNDNAVNPTYTPGTGDIAGGSVELCLTTEPISPCTISDTDCMTLYIQLLPIAYAGINATICEDDTYTLTDATAQNYSSVTWATNGDGTFDAPGTVNPTYTPGSGDKTTGSVELCITAEPISPCTVADTDCMTLTIQLLPIANAGEDKTICEDATYTLSDATAQNYSSVTWATNGDGSFDNENTVNPTYTPGTGDIAAEQVELCLTAEPINPCTVSDTDCMILYIQWLPEAYAGEDATICEDDTYTISDATAAYYSSVTWTTAGDGSFNNPTTVNPTYTPGTADKAAESVELCITAEPISPCTIAAEDCMTLYIQLLPIVSAGEDDDICESGTYTLSDATAQYYSSVTWTTAGDGTFDAETTVNPTYTPGSGDISTGSVELCIEAEPISPCTVSDSDCMTLSIQLAPIAYAGEDDTLCETEDVTLSDATATNGCGVSWTGGDGIFDDDETLNPTYSFGTDDIAAGTVDLCLTVAACDPCGVDSTDCLTITIQ